MRKFSNMGSALLVAAVNDSSPQLQLQTGVGDRFPSAVAPNFFSVTLEDVNGNFEICTCIARAPGSDVLQVVRAQEDTQASSFAANSRVELRTTQATLDGFIQRDGDIIDGGTF